MSIRKIPVELLEEARRERPPGYVEDVLANAEKVDDKYIYMECKVFRRLRGKWTPKSGPGTHLHAMLERFGIKASPGCSCTERMVQMNIWGPDRCEREIETISQWMKAEAKKRGLPYISTVGRMLVRRAIAKARREASCAKDTT